MNQDATLIELEKNLKELVRRKQFQKLEFYYPDEGSLRRELYSKHLEFFEAGKTFLERGAIAANRTGKTTLAAYETTLHLTGLYPHWWNGKRFNHAVDWWAASNTNETTRDILQLAFLGPLNTAGSGMIPEDLIVGEPARRRGVADSVDTIRVRHVTGGISTLAFKAFDQGREKFQGTKKHGITLDEEPDARVYFECLTRVMSTNPEQEDGTLICIFTPLKGMSAVVLMYLNETNPNRFVLSMGFDHVPHLSEESKRKLIASFPPHERDARAKGIPQLGSGAIYPVPESDIMVEDFPIPEHWPRAYSMDVGWNRTAAGWYARNPDTNVIYRYGEHYRGQAEPSIHAQSINSKGEWIPGVIDPASRGRSQKDGSQILQSYIDLGLDLIPAFNGVESGIYEVWQLLSSGQLKVFKSCQNWFTEFRLYRRDDNGKIVKENDHCMDETRYFVMSGRDIMKTKPVKKASEISYISGSNGWMG